MGESMGVTLKSPWGGPMGYPIGGPMGGPIGGSHGGPMGVLWGVPWRIQCGSHGGSHGGSRGVSWGVLWGVPWGSHGTHRKLLFAIPLWNLLLRSPLDSLSRPPLRWHSLEKKPPWDTPLRRHHPLETPS